MVAAAEASRGFRLSVFEIACSSIFVAFADSAFKSMHTPSGLKSLPNRAANATCNEASCCAVAGESPMTTHAARVAAVALQGRRVHCERMSGWVENGVSGIECIVNANTHATHTQTNAMNADTNVGDQVKETRAQPSNSYLVPAKSSS